MPKDEYDKDKPSLYTELIEGDEFLIFRASAFGMCVSYLVRCGLGYTPEPPPDFMLERYQEGTDAEPVILKWLHTTGGWRVWDDYALIDWAEPKGYRFIESAGQLETHLDVARSNRIRCHPDGIATCYLKASTEERYDTGEEAVVEAKAFGPDFAAKFKREGIMGFPYYAWQVSIEMITTGLPCVFVVAEKDDDGCVYPDVTPPQVHFFREPPYPIGKVKARAIKLRGLVDRSEIPECDVAQFPCGFYQEHDTTQGVWAKVKATEGATLDIEVALLDSLAEQYLEGHKMEKDGKEKKAAASKGLAIAFDSAKAKGTTIAGDVYEVKDQVNPKKGNVVWEDLIKGEFKKEVDDKTKDKYRKPGTEQRFPVVTPKGD